MNFQKKIYEGKAKTIFSGPKKNTLIQYFKDDATAFNAKKFQVLEGKGEINNLISEYLMGILSNNQISTHFIKKISNREQLIHECKIIPLEVVIRNISSGSLCKRLGIKEGLIFEKPIIEFYYKSDQLNDPIVNNNHIISFGWSDEKELLEINRISLKVNNILKRKFEEISISLIDFKLEFGRKTSDGSLVVADEISPDSCRLCDINSKEKFDKDIFRYDKGDLVESYKKLSIRLGIIK
ncbi:MAG: phosphoribosylaminoimidazolesuccinocarboxamide synthase [Paracoccaceae bacterium]|tara:strand:+ start:254 stop:970 length:717 start_codon:yes stop_codon:yes gene_type:complete